VSVALCSRHPSSSGAEISRTNPTTLEYPLGRCIQRNQSLVSLNRLGTEHP